MWEKSQGSGTSNSSVGSDNFINAGRGLCWNAIATVIFQGRWKQAHMEEWSELISTPSCKAVIH